MCCFTSKPITVHCKAHDWLPIQNKAYQQVWEMQVRHLKIIPRMLFGFNLSSQFWHNIRKADHTNFKTGLWWIDPFVIYMVVSCKAYAVLLNKTQDWCLTLCNKIEPLKALWSKSVEFWNVIRINDARYFCRFFMIWTTLIRGRYH